MEQILRSVVGIPDVDIPDTPILFPGQRNLSLKYNFWLNLRGDSAKNYISEKDFSDQGIELEYQEYQHPEYPQRYEGFVPFLSTIDLLFNCGDKSMEFLKKTDCA